jgi:hypothetical protein
MLRLIRSIIGALLDHCHGSLSIIVMPGARGSKAAGCCADDRLLARGNAVNLVRKGPMPNLWHDFAAAALLRNLRSRGQAAVPPALSSQDQITALEPAGTAAKVLISSVDFGLRCIFDDRTGGTSG